MTKTVKKAFTIVELLIVIVVIGILAGIVVVTYQGIQARAKTTAASTSAKEVRDKAEVFNSEESIYPTFEQLYTATSNPTGTGTSAAAGSEAVPTAKLGAETKTKLSTDAPDGTSGDNKARIQYAQCTKDVSGVTTVTGARISYWDYENNAVKSTVAGECS